MATTNADMQQRRGTAATATSEDRTLLAGEFGVETDTGKIKIGDGSTAWTSLAYIIEKYNLSELADITFTSTTNDDVVQRKAGVWVNRTVAQLMGDASLANMGTRAIDNLSDVDTTSAAPTTGDALVYDGSNWVPDSGTYSPARFGVDGQWEVIEVQEVLSGTASSLTFSEASAGAWEVFDSLRLRAVALRDPGGTPFVGRVFNMRVNGDTGSNYGHILKQVYKSGASAAAEALSSATAVAFATVGVAVRSNVTTDGGQSEVVIDNHAETGRSMKFHSSATADESGSRRTDHWTGSGWWTSSARVASITVAVGTTATFGLASMRGKFVLEGAR